MSMFRSCALLLVLVSLAAGARRHANKGTDTLDATGLPECLEQKTFPGQCKLSSTSGACFTEEGGDESVTVWKCWSNAEDPKNTDEQCKAEKYAGACKFADFGKETKDEDAQSCEALAFYDTQCSPVADQWGACYKEGKEWTCFGKDNTDEQQLLLKGDCRTLKVGESNEAYSGVCKFSHEVQKLSKCDNVPTFKADPCGTTGDSDRVCFSLKDDVTWGCYTAETLPKRCTSEKDSSGATWAGACLLKNAEGYGSAESYEKPKETDKPADAAATVKPTDKAEEPAATVKPAANPTDTPAAKPTSKPAAKPTEKPKKSASTAAVPAACLLAVVIMLQQS